jgi:2-oxoglutarate/2-oxoacid ferredoxin oxidoreductase subunit beta
MVTSLEAPATPLKAKDYKSDVHPDWCPGCGDFGIVNAIQQAMADLQLDPANTMMYSGVGCSSKTPHFIKTYAVHTLHGRSLPFSQGSKIANDDLNVVVAGGDGDGYGIGAGHFLNAGRRNVNMTYIVYNNEVYGLTKGQASPTLKLGMQPKSLAQPNPNDGINPLAIAIAAGYTFVARSYAFDAKHLRETLKRAMLHKGLAIVDVLQPCPTYNNLHTKDWFAEEVEIEGAKYPRTYDIEANGYTGIVSDPNSVTEVLEKKNNAILRTMQPDDRVPLGVFYQWETETYIQRVQKSIPMLKEYTSAKIPIVAADNVTPLTDLKEAYAAFRTDTY